jgi:UDP-3-O-[3-hydroxymyristoyl] glucosamine N-acyltransferase
LSRSQINETARIDPCAYISTFKVKIGHDCVIGPHVVVHENSILDDEVHLAAGCVVGSEGLEYRPFGKKVIPILQKGGVHIHRGVRIGALSCVNRSTGGGYTKIGEGSCIGEEALIGHNVTLGRRCHVESHAMIAGHVTTGDDVRICRNASISNRVIIGNSVRIGPGAVVTKMVQDGKSLSGNFAIDSARHRDFVKSAAEGNLGWLT